MTSHASLRALLLSTSLLAACAAEPPASATAAATPAAEASDRICAKEYPIGSNIAVMRCRTREQAENEKAAAAQGLGRSQSGGPNAKLGGN